jgi:hypothetical protein
MKKPTKKQSESSLLAERLRQRRAVTSAKPEVRYVKFTAEEMAIDAADVDMSVPVFKFGIVRLAPDVRKAFRDNESVNRALRGMLKTRRSVSPRRKSA